MQVDEDARKCVAFVGHAPNGEDSFTAFGTAFFAYWEGIRYLVTAKHVAAGLGEGPFDLRLNKIGGGSATLRLDSAEHPMFRWITDVTDDDLDLAVMMFPSDLRAEGYDVYGIAQIMLEHDNIYRKMEFGCGDTCYAIGLFRLAQGAKRNLPVVHLGSIATMPDDEPLPVRKYGTEKRIFVRGYLVAMQNLKGLSGAPVLVQPTIRGAVYGITDDKPPKLRGDHLITDSHSADMSLLGIWQASWDAPLDDVAALAHGKEERVPVGFGVVIPVERLVGILQQPDEQARRTEVLEEVAAGRAVKAD